MDKYKKEHITARITADKAAAIRELAAKRGILITDVMSEIVDYYFTEPAPAPEPQERKECIVITDLHTMALAALLECSEKLGKTYPQTIDLLFEKVIELGGRPDQPYIDKANEMLKGE